MPAVHSTRPAPSPPARSLKWHEDQFRPPTLSVRCRFGHLTKTTWLLLDDLENGFAEGADELLRVDRPEPRIIPEPRYFSIPSTVGGGVALRNEALNWTPCVSGVTIS
jgi:hypothetical protein